MVALPFTFFTTPSSANPVPASQLDANFTFLLGTIKGVAPYFVDVRWYGALLDGVTNDSAAFTAAFVASPYVTMPAGKTAIVGNLVLSGPNAILECNGSTLQAAPGSLWVIKKTGNNNQIRNAIIADPTFANKVSTTLNAIAAGGATSLTFSATTGFANGMPVCVLLNSGAYWPTKIKPVGGISGTTVIVVDPIPFSATAIAVSAGGTLFNVGDAVVAQGGIGPPVTAKVATVSGGGVVTGLTLQAPGFYSTIPANPVSFTSFANGLATGLTANLTTSGAASGKSVEGSWGSLVVDQAAYGGLTNILFTSGFAGLGVFATATSVANPTAQETFANIGYNGSKFFSQWVDAGVFSCNFVGVIGYGSTGHGASAYGTVGMMRNYTQPTFAFPVGGNHFSNNTFLGFENGTIDNLGGNDVFDDGFTVDGCRNYGFIGNGCTSNTFTGMPWAGFSGPSANVNVAGYGIGWYFGNYTAQGGSPTGAINNSLPGTTGGNNAADFHFADYAADGTGYGSSLFITSGASAPLPTYSGFTAAIQAPRVLMSGNSGGSAGGGGTTFYMGNGIGKSATEGAVASPIGFQAVVTRFFVAADTAPGVGQSNTVNLRQDAKTIATVTISGGVATSAIYTGPGITLTQDLPIDVQVVPSAGAAAATFRWNLSGM